MSRRGNGGEEEVPVAVPPPAEEEAPAEEAGLEAAAPGEGAAGDLESLRRERDELKDALLRRRADFENYRRRVERDRGAAATEAEAAILSQLLGTVDNLERALAAEQADSALRQGVELTLRELTTLLEGLGVVRVDPAGERFDPSLHQAIVHEPVPGLAEGTVAEVYRKGYVYKERLLRPALVKVASGELVADDGGDVQ